MMRLHQPGRRRAVLGMAALVVVLLAWTATGDARRPTMTEVLMGDARRGDVKGIENTLKHGADVNGRTDGGQTPLMLAAERGHLAAVDALLKASAKVDPLDKGRYDALTRQLGGGAEIPAVGGVIRPGLVIDLGGAA